jgi:hypothetical protein
LQTLLEMINKEMAAISKVKRSDTELMKSP